MCETLSQYASELTLPRHTASQRDLMPYADLMAWLKTAEPESFEKLTKVCMYRRIISYGFPIFYTIYLVFVLGGVKPRAIFIQIGLKVIRFAVKPCGSV